MIKLYPNGNRGQIMYYRSECGRYLMERGELAGKWVLMDLRGVELGGRTIFGSGAYRGDLAEEHGFRIDPLKEWKDGVLRDLPNVNKERF